MGVQIIPQDIGPAARFASGFLPQFGEGFGDISRQLMQQQIREELVNKAVGKLGKDVPQFMKDIFQAQGMLGQQPDFSRTYGLVLNQAARKQWNDQSDKGKAFSGPPSSIKDDIEQDVYQTENPNATTPDNSYPPPPQNRFSLPQFQPRQQAIPQQVNAGLAGFPGSLPYSPEKYLDISTYNPEMAALQKKEALETDVNRFKHPSEVAQAAQQYFDQVMEPYIPYIQEHGYDIPELEPALKSIVLKNRTGNYTKDLAQTQEDIQQLVRNFDNITLNKNKYADAMINPESRKELFDKTEGAVQNLNKMGLKDFQRRKFSDYFSDEVFVESLLDRVPEDLGSKSSKYANSIKAKYPSIPVAGKGEFRSFQPSPKIGRFSEKDENKIAENFAKLWKPWVQGGHSLFSMWENLSNENIPDDIVRQTISILQDDKDILFNDQQIADRDRINSAGRYYYRRKGMQQRLSGPLYNSLSSILDFFGPEGVE